MFSFSHEAWPPTHGCPFAHRVWAHMISGLCPHVFWPLISFSYIYFWLIGTKPLCAIYSRNLVFIFDSDVSSTDAQIWCGHMWVCPHKPINIGVNHIKLNFFCVWTLRKGVMWCGKDTGTEQSTWANLFEACLFRGCLLINLERLVLLFGIAEQESVCNLSDSHRKIDVVIFRFCMHWYVYMV